MIGRTISHYRIVEQLGGGGMGVVYRAEDTRLGRVVALKFLPVELSGDPEAVDRFQREGRAASALNHPHICTIHDVGNDDGRRFIVMELLQGHTLKHAITSQPMPLGRILDLAIQIADALNTAHLHGIVHRDIKPANLFVTARGDAKVLDFGLAKLTPQSGGAAGLNASAMTRPQEFHTDRGVAMGTIAYMSPEQIRGEAVDGRSDVFSFGLVLYEMATGRRAFAEGTTGVIFDAILNRAPAPLLRVNPDLPAEFERILSKALEKDPALRYQRAGDLLVDLQRLRRDVNSGRATAAVSATGSASSGTSAGTPTPPRRTPAMVIAAIAAALALVGWFAWRNTTSNRDTGAGISPDVVAGKARLVVLPFENLTRQPADDWLAGAFSDALTVGLQNLEGLILVNRERIVELYAEQTVREAAPLDPQVVRRLTQALGVRYYVHGSYQKVGDEIKVVARLVEAESGTIRAQDSLTDQFSRILQLEDDLARKFAGSLEAGAGFPANRRETPSLEAYQAVTEAGRAYAIGAMENSRKNLERALQLDPSYAQALALLSKVYSRLTSPASLVRGSVEYRQKALDAGRRAVELDPRLYDAHVALALAHRSSEQFEPWRAEAQEAITLNPRQGEAYALLADSYSGSPTWGCARDRDPARAERYYDQAVRVDPRLSAIYNNLAFHRLSTGRPLNALQAVDDGLALMPASRTLRQMRARILVTNGRVDEAARELLDLTGGKPGNQDVERTFGALELARGNVQAAARHFDLAIAAGDSASVRVNVAANYGAAGRIPEAVSHLDKAFQMDRHCVRFVADSPMFADARRDPLLKQLLATAGRER